MAAIGKKFGAIIAKTGGDSLVLYFPQTSNKNDKRAFKDVIDCGITMLAAFNFINFKMSGEDLPPVGYRISSDYGRSEIARSNRTDNLDLFGSAMNICGDKSYSSSKYHGNRWESISDHRIFSFSFS
jgi:two-component system, OmpR family, response regulator ChvI